MSGWNKTLVSKVTPLSTAKPVSEKIIDDQKATSNKSEKAFMTARERVSVFVAAVKEAFEQGDGSSFDLRGWLKDALIYVFFLMVFTLYIWAGRVRAFCCGLVLSSQFRHFCFKGQRMSGSLLFT